MELRLVPEYLSDEDLILQQRRRLESSYYCSPSLISAKPLLGKNPRKKKKFGALSQGGRLGGKGGVKGGKKKINKFHFIRREKMQE